VRWAHPTDAAGLGLRVLGWGIGNGLDLQVTATKATVRLPGKAAREVVRRVSVSPTARKRQAREAATPTTPGTPGAPATPVGPSMSGAARGSGSVAAPGVVWQP